MERLWFKRRRFGWGWTPASKEGWLTLIGFFVAVLIGAVVLSVTVEDDEIWPVVAYLVFVAGAVLTLIVLAVTHGPVPRWRWGRKPQDDPTEDY